MVLKIALTWGLSPESPFTLYFFLFGMTASLPARGAGSRRDRGWPQIYTTRPADPGPAPQLHLPTHRSGSCPPLQLPVSPSPVLPAPVLAAGWREGKPLRFSNPSFSFSGRKGPRDLSRRPGKQALLVFHVELQHCCDL